MSQPQRRTQRHSLPPRRGEEIFFLAAGDALARRAPHVIESKL